MAAPAAAASSWTWVTRLRSLVFHDFRKVLYADKLGMEIAHISIPTGLALMADPIASLIDTAFVGHIGHVELAAVGVAIIVFNQVSKVATVPLISVTTSFIAEESSTLGMSGDNIDVEMESELSQLIGSSNQSSSTYDGSTENFPSRRQTIPSALLAMIVGSAVGISQTIFLLFSGNSVLSFMGVESDSPMLNPALEYLTVRSLGAPAVLLSLAMLGIFRGLKDTKTPLFATITGNTVNILLDPLFIFMFKMGVTGAAIAHVISQYLIALILLWRLILQVNLMPPNLQDLQFGRFMKSGLLLLVRVCAVTFCTTLAASLATKQGPTSMAAFQICFQIWLATSLLSDGLAVAAQAILASRFPRKDYDSVKAAASRVLQLGFLMGSAMSMFLTVALQFASKLFTTDANVLRVMNLGLPFVALTQPINSLAFVFDGINYGASDFEYSAYSMVVVALVSIPSLFLLSSSLGFVGIWLALSMYMTLRALTGFCRIGAGIGPWNFLQK